MLKYGTEYTDIGQEYYEQRYKDRVIANLKRKAKNLGYKLITTDLVNAHPKDAIFLDMRKYMMKKNCKKLQSKGQIHAFSLFPMSNY